MEIEGRLVQRVTGEPALKRLKVHEYKWKDCIECTIGKKRKNIALWRGLIPAEVLFIGERPNEVDDEFGYPFVGSAGMLLDQIIQMAFDELENPEMPIAYPTDGFSYAITTQIACATEGNRIANLKEIKRCAPRLNEFIEVANPQIVCLVGKDAYKVKTKAGIERIKIPNLFYLSSLGASRYTQETRMIVSKIVAAVRRIRKIEVLW